MGNRRIFDHPILGTIKDDKIITFIFNSKKYEGIQGDTIASALLANNIRTLRYQEETGKPRGIYCNIGHCFECRVNVNENEGIRACLTPIIEGMDVKSLKSLPTPFAEKEDVE